MRRDFTAFYPHSHIIVVAFVVSLQVLAFSKRINDNILIEYHNTNGEYSCTASLMSTKNSFR